MATGIYLLRHVESEGNRDGMIMGSGVDSVLTDHGQRDAEAIAEFLNWKKIDAIYVGPSKRSKVTAEIIAKRIGCRIIVTEKLKARDYGSLAGKKYEEIGMQKSEMTSEDSLNCLGKFECVEKIESVKLRLTSIIDEILKQRDSKVLIIGHGFINSILASLLIGEKIESKSLYRQRRGQIGFFNIDEDKRCIDFISDVSLNNSILQPLTGNARWKQEST